MHLKKIAALVLSLILFTGMAPGASAVVPLPQLVREVPRNETGITIYDQGAYADEEWALTGYAGRTLASSGCFMFTFAHAVQYLTGEAWDDDDLRGLMAVCRDPNGRYKHDGCRHEEVTGTGYLPMNDVLGYPIGRGASPIRDANGCITEKGYTRYFEENDGVLCIHGAGHYILAVDMMTVNDVAYVRIIDSNWGAVQDRTGMGYYFLEIMPGGSPWMRRVLVDEDTYKHGCDFWMRADEISGFFRFTFNWVLSDAAGGQ